MPALPTVLPIPEPALAQAPVEVLLGHFSGALPWLSHPYGLVQTGVEPKGGNKLPQLYAQDGKLFSIDLGPDQSAKAVCWIEQDGPTTFDWTDGLHKAATITHPLAAVVWLNLPAIDPNRPYDFSSELAVDFLTRGLLASPLGAKIAPESIEQRQERVFARYQWPVERQQLCMYPYAAFRVPFTVSEPYVACPKPFVPASAPMPTGPISVRADVNIPLGSLVAYNEQGNTVLYDAASDPEGQSLYGIAITNGTIGQQVTVFTQPGATVSIPQWGLQAGRTYFAGRAGKLVTSDQGLFFSQVIGRALTADTFLYQPEDLVILLPSTP